MTQLNRTSNQSSAEIGSLNTESVEESSIYRGLFWLCTLRHKKGMDSQINIVRSWCI